MNILVTTFSFPAPGERVYDGQFVLAESMAYARAGARVRVVTPHIPGTERKERLHANLTVFRFRYVRPARFQRLKQAGVPLYGTRSGAARLQWPLLCLALILATLRHARWANLIHAQWTATALLGLPAKWLLGRKLVLTARGSDLRLLPAWLNRFIHRRVDAAVDCFGPQPWNETYKDRFRARYLRLPLIVRDDHADARPPDLPAALQGKPQPFVILYVGRFEALKVTGNRLPLLDLLLAAGEIKCRGGAALHLFYVGDGSLRARMRRMVRELHLENHVTLLGPKNNVPDYVACCHLGAGGIAFNGVSQEFTVQGKPQLLVDGADNAGTPWHHGRNAVFFCPGEPQDLARKIRWCVEHPGEAADIGRRAREDMAPHMVGLDAGGQQYLEAFRRLSAETA